MNNDFTKYLETTGEIGYVDQTIGSVVYATGLPTARPHELVVFENGELGEVLRLHKDAVEILTYSEHLMKVGTRVTRTGEYLQIPVGESLLGHTINPLCVPLTVNENWIKPQEKRSMYSTPSNIEARAKITTTLETGVTAIDMLVPLARGQRELVMGDRKTGKTSFLLQTMLTQARHGTICIYAAIGKKRNTIKQVEEFLKKENVLDKTIIIATSPEDPNGLLYLTPFTAMTIAEFMRDTGQDVLVIFDDLVTHAKFCREIALLAKRFPGRNSYPIDIFFTHSQLLERAGNFKHEKGDVSITALPVAETYQGDVTGYIQTNLMSITDGHIYFDSDLYTSGRRPAINPFVSVTRVGHQTQNTLRQTISRELISFLTLAEKMESYTHYGAELNLSVKQILQTRENMLLFLTQLQYLIIPINAQIYIFGLLWSNIWNSLPPEEVKNNIALILRSYETSDEVRTSVNTMLEQAETLNELLHLIVQNVNEVLGKAKSYEQQARSNN